MSYRRSDSESGCFGIAICGLASVVYIGEHNGWIGLLWIACGVLSLCFLIWAVGRIKAWRAGQVRCHHGGRARDSCRDCRKEKDDEVEKRRAEREMADAAERARVSERLKVYDAKRREEREVRRLLRGGGMWPNPAWDGPPRSTPSAGEQGPATCPPPPSAPLSPAASSGKQPSGRDLSLGVLPPSPPAVAAPPPPVKPPEPEVPGSGFWLFDASSHTEARQHLAALLTTSDPLLKAKKGDCVFLWGLPGLADGSIALGRARVEYVTDDKAARQRSATLAVVHGFTTDLDASLAIVQRLRLRSFNGEGLVPLSREDGKELSRLVNGTKQARPVFPPPALVPQRGKTLPSPEREDGESARPLIPNPPHTARRSPSQGFALSAPARRAVELRAMAIARAHYEAAGFEINDVSAQQSFDLLCVRLGRTLYVEVKGTTEAGPPDSVFITPNEERLARELRLDIALFVVHGIVLDDADGQDPSASGGVKHIFDPWDIDACRVEPVTLKCYLPAKSNPSQLALRLPDPSRSE